MAESVKTFQAHLTAVMDSLVRASVCEITKLFQDTVNDYLVEISLNRKENEALKLRLRLTENKLRNERKYGMGWAAGRRAAGLLGSEDTAVRKARKADLQSKIHRVMPLLFYREPSWRPTPQFSCFFLLPLLFLHSSLPLLFSSLLLPPPVFFSGGKPSGAWEERAGGGFRAHLNTGGGDEEEEMKEVASIKEEVSSQSYARKHLQGVEEKERGPRTEETTSKQCFKVDFDGRTTTQKVICT